VAKEVIETSDKYYQERHEKNPDSLKVVELGKIKFIKIEFHPSFNEAHEIIINPESKYLMFVQTTDNARFEPPKNSSNLTQKELEEFQQSQKDLYYSKNFYHNLTEKETNQILENLKELKRENYKNVRAETMDGIDTRIFILENNSMKIIRTNYPTYAQFQFLENILFVSKIYAKDSATRKNITDIIGYL